MEGQMKKIKIRSKQLGALLLTLSVALPAAAEKAEPDLDAIAHSTLKFMNNIQVKKPDGIYVNGEWKAEVYAAPVSEVLGIGETTGNEEPSAFTTGSIMNQLAMIYKDHPEFSEIKPMLNKAEPSLERFREGSLYNFYPPKMIEGTRVHQAASMRLGEIWKGFTNVPEDTDTTSVAYAARYYTDKINGKDTKVPAQVFKSLERFRDVNRDPHWYNEKERFVKTGAFLTWHMDENDPNNPNRQFGDARLGKRIPFETNDVDCIVNLNALRMMSLSGHSNSTGRDKACGLMAYVIQSEDYAKCGIYYPNTYNFAYSAAQADEAGETCLRPYAKQMLNFILKNQDANGSWENKDNYESEDRVQATAYAMHALAHFGDPKDKRVQRALARGTKFLLSRMKRARNGGTYWEGETFFTATALARSVIDWKSDGYTTTTALGALLDAKKFLQAGKAQAPAAHPAHDEGEKPEAEQAL
jgi:hypothetical protein